MGYNHLEHICLGLPAARSQAYSHKRQLLVHFHNFWDPRSLSSGKLTYQKKYVKMMNTHPTCGAFRTGFWWSSPWKRAGAPAPLYCEVISNPSRRQVAVLLRAAGAPALRRARYYPAICQSCLLPQGSVMKGNSAASGGRTRLLCCNPSTAKHHGQLIYLLSNPRCS